MPSGSTDGYVGGYVGKFQYASHLGRGEMETWGWWVGGFIKAIEYIVSPHSELG